VSTVQSRPRVCRLQYVGVIELDVVRILVALGIGLLKVSLVHNSHELDHIARVHVIT